MTFPGFFRYNLFIPLILKNMRTAIQTVTRGAVALLLAMTIAPVVQAPDLVALLRPPANTAVMPPASAPSPGEGKAAPASRRPAKPIMVWEAVSSWYGEDFDGRPTAKGESFDMYADTAAHPSLPLGSIVRVVYPRTGRSRIVRINDRGPYVEGRELDVSYEVARELGFYRSGLARVRIELLKLPRHFCQQRRPVD